ncbi:MAG: TonB-dependent receptor [Prevotellaceae bacterium]|jgi:TonB-linked SusC/RagA family outer membrane protein|nr:TonB-dependent receptor [Prevotellaceae bacterium]
MIKKRKEKESERTWKKTGFRAGIFLLLAWTVLPLHAQTNTISGTVFDAKGETIIGASIVVKGTTMTTVTDALGRFTIEAAPEATLVVSFIGYRTQEIAVGNQTDIRVLLEEDTKVLEEVVVVGYGTQKRAHLTGAVSQISSKELTIAPMQNTSNLLTGKIAGLTSIQRSGKPGDDGTTMYVRGRNSFKSGTNSPIIIVDGVQRLIDYVNPNDIESIAVLKDAAASIYGVQGANGVILITTKTGGEGPAKIAYDGSYSITQNTAMPDFLNATEYMYWHNKARAMDGLTPLWTADIQNKVLTNDPNSIWGETNWLDKVFNMGQTQQHNISASGGTEKTKYYTSIGIMDQEGTLINTGYTRYNMRANLDILVAKNMRFIINLSGNRADTDWPGTAISNQAEFDPIRQAINTIPIIKSEFQGMNTAWNDGTYNKNGYAALTESGYKRKTAWRMDSNFKLEYDFSGLTGILKGLKASLFAAYNYSNTTNSNYDRYYYLYAVNANLDEGISGISGVYQDGSYSKSASWGDTWLLRPQIDYSREFGKHYVGALLFYEAQKHYNNTMTGNKRGYYSDDPVDLSLGSTFPYDPTYGIYPVSGSYYYTGQASYAGRLNYVYDRKYLVELAFRRDGSYIFAPENRWGFFPSASVGWVISQEEFFAKAAPFVDFLKLRASYGQSGYADGDVAYLYNSRFNISVNSMVLGGAPIAQFYTANAYIYRNLTWASTESYNVGIDASLWNKKLGIELDVFYKITDGILESQAGNYPSSLSNYFPSYRNSGKVDNRGFEIILKHENRINSDWSYELNGSFSFSRNRVLKKAVTDAYPNYRGVFGETTYDTQGFIALGLFQTQEEIDQYPAAPSGRVQLGDLKYKDINGDGIISSQYDYMKIGYGTVPEINFSLNMSVSWRGFYATLLWQGVTHCDYELSGVYDTGVTSSTPYTAPFPSQANSPRYLIEGAWTPDNPNASYPRLTTVANGNNAWQSTWWLVNGEYLRLKNANIGYSIPEQYLRKMPFAGVNIYLAGTNLLTFSHFKYVDPESPSVSRGYYPQQRTFSLGLNLTF